MVIKVSVSQLEVWKSSRFYSFILFFMLYCCKFKAFYHIFYFHVGVKT
jgi:hypothetical protein